MDLPSPRRHVPRPFPCDPQGPTAADAGALAPAVDRHHPAVFAVVATSIFGFTHVTAQQAALTSLREASQRLRDVRQALIEADADMLHVLGGDTRA